MPTFNIIVCFFVLKLSTRNDVPNSDLYDFDVPTTTFPNNFQIILLSGC